MPSGKFAMTVVMLIIFIVMVSIAWQYPPQSRFMPFVVGIPAIALCLLQLYLDFRDSRRINGFAPARARYADEARQEIARAVGRKIDFDAALGTAPAVAPSETVRREMIVWGYFLGLVGGVLLFGFLLTVPVFAAVFLRQWAKTSLRFALGLAATASAVLYLIFIQGLNVVPHPGFVTEYVLERLLS